MKRNYIKTIIGTTLMAMFLPSCSDILDEQPRSIYEPGYFKTEAGVNGGLTGLYANLRYIYGNAYYFNACLTGTDEATWAQSADGNFKDMDLSGAGSLTASSSRSDVLWNNAFPSINNASGIIENGSAVGVSPALLAEAHFFRGFHYLMLVQTFGGVPLDLGSGELKFNITPVRFSVRNTVPEVYTLAVFPDLENAVENLTDVPRFTGGLTKNVARLFLAKAYLAYGWWLENPNDIPTYPEVTSRTDPNGHDAQWYFQQAYDLAVYAIDNPSPYALQETFYDVHVGSNDRNKEIMLYADHTEASEKYNGASLTYGSGGGQDNFAVWMMTWNYTNIRSSANGTEWTVSSVQREAAQPLGRPWTRMCPTIGVIENTFADKTNDSRYDGTFTTVYRGNWNKGGNTSPTLYNANSMQVAPGDPILTFLSEEPAIDITYPELTKAGHSAIGAGELPSRADYVISPRGISRLTYPGLWKLGVYRTDNAGGLGQPNAGSTRPFNIAKFSEFYFVAAEAAVKGATTDADKSARDLINVIRARAGKWKWDNANNTAKVEDNSDAMVTATPAVIDLNYILEERSREYYAEGYRWLDLVRTQKWADIAGTFEICSDTIADHSSVTFRRNITPDLYIRPIPLGQLDAMDMTEEERDLYQNPAYRD